MIRNALILAFITVSLQASSVCNKAYDRAVYYSEQANNYSLNTRGSACKMADNLEQLLNNMGTLKANSCSQYNAATFSMYAKMLMAATSKCGR